MREAPATASITELKDSQGSILHEREDLENICVQFYTELYAWETLSPHMLADRADVLNPIPHRFSPNMIHQLDQPLTKQELHDALLSMANGKSPGPNGIITEFFKRFWDLIGDEFFDMVRHSIEQGKLPPGMTSRTITLLFKTGDKADLANWRPITLLNVSYKIVAKALQIRLQQTL